MKKMREHLEAFLIQDDLSLFESLDSPVKIQNFLDNTRYSPEDRNRCPLNVIRDRQAHCLDGGLFAAAALSRLGYPPLIIDLYPEIGIDDDHVLAIFKENGFWGAVAKSNYVGLRYREPVYRNLRELVMSYFDLFYNINGIRTLRSYSRPINVSRFDRYEWEFNDQGADKIESHLKTLSAIPVISPIQIVNLTPLDELSYRAGMLAANPEGLYKPKR